MFDTFRILYFHKINKYMCVSVGGGGGGGGTGSLAMDVFKVNLANISD